MGTEDLKGNTVAYVCEAWMGFANLDEWVPVPEDPLVVAPRTRAVPADWSDLCRRHVRLSERLSRGLLEEDRLTIEVIVARTMARTPVRYPALGKIQLDALHSLRVSSLTAEHLRKELGTPKHVMQRVLESLEKHGLVAFNPGPSTIRPRWNAWWRPTEDGLAAVVRAEATGRAPWQVSREQ